MRNLNEPRKTDNTEHRNAPADIRAVPNDTPRPLFSKEHADEMQTRWTTIQSNFIDDPRRAVKEADALVASAIKQISDSFSDQRNQLERRWSAEDKVSTEDLRLTLQQYRAFLSRLSTL